MQIFQIAYYFLYNLIIGSFIGFYSQLHLCGGHVAQAEAAGPLSPGLLYGSAMVSKRSAPGDVSSAALAQSRLGGARDGLGRFRLRLAPQGQPWEASAWAARECTSGPQDVYVPFADIRPRQAYADARVAAPWRFFHMRRCANSVAAQGQRDWGSPGNGWRRRQIGRASCRERV